MIDMIVDSNKADDHWNCVVVSAQNNNKKKEKKNVAKEEDT